jgi:hypothetical protein
MGEGVRWWWRGERSDQRFGAREEDTERGAGFGERWFYMRGFSGLEMALTRIISR